MRDDMAKMLVETHRSTAPYKYKKHRRTNKQKDPDALPSKEGMRNIYGWDRKEFGENFAPLRGFLHKNVGRPWAKVYSELSKGLTGGGTVIDHVKVHLWQFVTRKPFFDIRGKAWHPPLYGFGRSKLMPFTDGEWYIDLHGFLREGKPIRRQKVAQPKIYVRKGGKEYLKLKDIWYEINCAPIVFEDLEFFNNTVRLHDVASGTILVVRYDRHYRGVRHSATCKSDLWGQYAPRSNRRCIKKRQLSSREIRRIK